MKATGTIPTPRSAGRAAARRRARRVGVAAAALVALALLATACGGGSPSSDVAHLGTNTASSSSSNSSSGSSSSGSSAASGTGGSGGSAAPGGQAVAYSACMREHGVPNFPEPKISTNGSEVRVAVRVTPAITGNPKFNTAQKACAKLLPGGGPGEGSNHQISPKEQAQYLKAVACIRAHGVPSFPDPTFSGSGVHIPRTAGDSIRLPRVRAAAEACQSLIPGGLHGNH